MTKPASLLFAVLAAATLTGSAEAQSNRIQIENAKAGSTDWLLTRVARHDDEIYELGWHRRRGIEASRSRKPARPLASRARRSPCTSARSP